MSLFKEGGLAESVIEFGRLADKAQLKRLQLEKYARRRTSIAKCLHLVAGAFALVSASSITAVISDFTNLMTVKISSAALGFVSGFITLVFSTYFDEKETQRIFDGSTKFLKIREEAHLIGMRPDTTEKQAYTLLAKLQADYVEFSKEFDHFLPRSFYDDGIKRT
jgi:hypothetical protein